MYLTIFIDVNQVDNWIQGVIVFLNVTINPNNKIAPCKVAVIQGFGCKMVRFKNRKDLLKYFQNIFLINTIKYNYITIGYEKKLGHILERWAPYSTTSIKKN